MVKEFGKQRGEGEKLQRLLEEYSQHTDNWVSFYNTFFLLSISQNNSSKTSLNSSLSLSPFPLFISFDLLSLSLSLSPRLVERESLIECCRTCSN